MKIIAVEHMDEVLRVALAHVEPDEFLPTASEAVDWRTEQPARRRDGGAAGSVAGSVDGDEARESTTPTQPGATPAPPDVVMS